MITRTCKYVKCGGPMPVTARADADFCRPEHKSAHHNEQRRLGAGTDKRLTPASDGEGSRGGNVRSVSEARDLQAQQRAKRDWSGAIDEQIRRTLIETGYFHADDLDALGVPPEHCNLKGTRAASFANRKLMERSGAERKVSHAAANGRKAPIYRITAKGRAKLVGVGGGGVASPAAGGASLHSGEPAQSSAGVPTAQAEGGVEHAPIRAGDGADGEASGSLTPDVSPPLFELPPDHYRDTDQRAA